MNNHHDLYENTLQLLKDAIKYSEYLDEIQKQDAKWRNLKESIIYVPVLVIGVCLLLLSRLSGLENFSNFLENLSASVIAAIGLYFLIDKRFKNLNAEMRFRSREGHLKKYIAETTKLSSKLSMESEDILKSRDLLSNHALSNRYTNTIELIRKIKSLLERLQEISLLQEQHFSRQLETLKQLQFLYVEYGISDLENYVEMESMCIKLIKMHQTIHGNLHSLHREYELLEQLKSLVQEVKQLNAEVKAKTNPDPQTE